MDVWESLARLSLRIDEISLEPLALATSSGWTRHSTVVRLSGGGHCGLGEDVTYEANDQRAFQQQGPPLLADRGTTLGGFCARLAETDLFPRPPASPANRSYRRWAFESAALDLALRQRGRALHEWLGRTPRPVRFVVSLGLGDPPALSRIERIRALVPGARFKVDYAESWSPELIARLAALEVVDTIDLKGYYVGAFRGPRTDATLCRQIVERLPGAWIEDPQIDSATRPVLEQVRERVSWDAILHGVADIEGLPWPPGAINVKPSRFGSIAELLAVYAWCEEREVAMYGGGQYELGPGRGQIQYLAGLFHPDAANDVAPVEFNHAKTSDRLAASPLEPMPDPIGFRLG